MSDTGRRDRAAPPAVRLRCVADRDGVRVVSRRTLEKVVPPSESRATTNSPSLVP